MFMAPSAPTSAGSSQCVEPARIGFADATQYTLDSVRRLLRRRSDDLRDFAESGYLLDAEIGARP
jgi:hypothetical protein